MSTPEDSVHPDKVRYTPTSQNNGPTLVLHPGNSYATRLLTTLSHLRILSRWPVNLRLLPILTLLYLLSFLDSGLDFCDTHFWSNLHILVPAYNTAMAIYFVGYIIFGVPLNRLTLMWGIVSACQGLVKNYAGLFGVRLQNPRVLVVIEAGRLPGIICLFSVYNQRHERSWRVTIVFGGAALAGAFGRIFAYAVGLMDGIGILTEVISLIAYLLAPTWSFKAKLAEHERLLERLRINSNAGMNQTLQWSSVRQAFGDHLVWVYDLLFHGFSFVPTIIADLSFVTMAVPPNALAGIPIWKTVWLSGRWSLRAPLIIAAALVAIVVIRVGFSGQTKRAIAVALRITGGDIAAIAGCLIYRPSLSAHLCRKPNLIAIGCLLFAILATCYLWVMMARENRKRLMLLAEGKIDYFETEEERIRLDVRSIHYTYQL
ncbi:major facilitator superfamily domain-containing protein [Pisolithus tinctorius]|nr:major facilitator superfamily domain-containing protein [Pisolithus tinctorius]